jgi:hypothetical protein
MAVLGLVSFSAVLAVVLFVTLIGHVAWRFQFGSRLQGFEEYRGGATTRPTTNPAAESRPATSPASESRPATRPVPESRPAGEAKTESRPAATQPATKQASKSKPADKPIELDPKLAAGRPFSPVVKKRFALKLVGLLGDMAIFSAGGSEQSAKVGGQVAGAKVLAVGPDFCEIEFDGKKQTLRFAPGVPGGGGPSGPSPGRRGGPPPVVPGKAAPAPAPAAVRLPPGIENLPAAVQAQIKERMKRRGAQ